MTNDEMKAKIQIEPDFIALKRFGYSLRALLEKHPDGVPEKLIAQALLLTEAEVAEIYEGSVQKLRSHLGADDDVG